MRKEENEWTRTTFQRPKRQNISEKCQSCRQFASIRFSTRDTCIAFHGSLRVLEERAAKLRRFSSRQAMRGGIQ